MNTRVERWKTIINIAWPLIIANSFWNLQLTIDRLFLSRHSTEAIGAVIAVMGVFWTPMALLQQTAAYLTTFTAQYRGARQLKNIGPALWQSLYISIGGGLLFLLFIPGSNALFAFMGHAESTRVLEVGYFNAICFSALPTAIIATTSAFFTGLGSTRVIILINSVGLAGNVIFDYLLIFGNLGFPAMGVKGAGYATALANTLAAGYGIYLVFTADNEKKYHVYSGWTPNLDTMKRYIKYGLPSGLQWALEGLAFSVFLIIIGRMEQGSAALASSGIVVTVMLLAVLPVVGIAQAGSVLVGEYLGGKNPEEAEASTWSTLQVGLLYIVPLGVSFILVPGFYLNWFYNPENQQMWNQVNVMVPILLMYVGFFTSFDCINLVFSFALKGAGDTRFVSLVALLIPWPIMVIPSWFLRNETGALYWAWGAASIYVVTQSLIYWRRFAGSRWKHMSVIRL